MDQNLMNRIQAMMQQRGASGNGIMGYASGGGVPRQTMIADQPHMLAYINPEEEMMLQASGLPSGRSYGSRPRQHSFLLLWSGYGEYRWKQNL